MLSVNLSEDWNCYDDLEMAVAFESRIVKWPARVFANEECVVLF